MAEKSTLLIQKRGWLKKERRTMGFTYGWKDRWFVLRGNELSYYKSEGEATAKKGGIVLGVNEAYEDKKQPFVFQLLVGEGDGPSMKKKKYNLSAPTKAERDLWLDACHVVSKGVPGRVSMKDLEAITAFLDDDEDGASESDMSSPRSRSGSSTIEDSGPRVRSKSSMAIFAGSPSGGGAAGLSKGTSSPTPSRGSLITKPKSESLTGGILEGEE